MARRRKARHAPKLPTTSSRQKQPRHRRRARKRSPSPPFVISGIFPLASLPPELTLRIATFLDNRSRLDLLVCSREFGIVSDLFNKLSREDYTMQVNGLSYTYTPLQFFCSRGIESFVRRLLREGADPNIVSFGKPKNQLSPLMHAIGFHSLSIVSLLLKHNARINDRDGWGADEGLEPTTCGCAPLRVAAAQPHSIHPVRFKDPEGYKERAEQLSQIVKLLIESGAEINSHHPKRGTPLHVACTARNANPLIVKALIAGGADVHAVTELENRTLADVNIQPIHYAASAGHASIVQMLLGTGADLEAKTRDGMRALDNAIITMRGAVVDVLIEAGADIGCSDTHDFPPSNLMRMYPWPGVPMDKEVVQLLAEAGSDSGVVTSEVLRAVELPNLYRLLEKTIKWGELFWWLQIRGWRYERKSMAAWGITDIDTTRPRNYLRCNAFM